VHESRNRKPLVPENLPIGIKGILQGILLLIIFGVLLETCKEFWQNPPQLEQMEE
jgi:hypothetical protein